jgi:hypothetical protein
MTDPTTPASELLERMLQNVFNEQDPDRRASAIEELFAEGVVFTDPDRVVRGRDDLTSTVTALLAEGPGFVFTPNGPFQGVGDLGMRRWSLGPAGEPAVVGGLDVVRVADGRIAELWTILDA